LQIRFYYVSNVVTTPEINKINENYNTHNHQHDDILKSAAIVYQSSDRTKITLFSRPVNIRIPNVFESFKVSAFEMSKYIRIQRYNYVFE